MKIDEISKQKDLIRKKLLACRNEFASSFLTTSSLKICGYIEELIKANEVETVFSFASIQNEPDLMGLFSFIINRNVDLAYPKIIPNSHQMDFYKVENKDDLYRTGKYQIPEPKSSPSTNCIPDMKTLVLVPTLGLSLDGERLGYGGGFYDRYLAGYPNSFKVAVLFDEFFGIEGLRSTNTDIAIKICVTEKGIRYL